MSDPTTITADEFVQAVHEQFPQIAEIVRLRLIVSKQQQALMPQMKAVAPEEESEGAA